MFINQLDAVLKYFPTGTAEGERKLLEHVFITPQQMETVMSTPAGSPRILVGTKGTGKSAIVYRIHDAALANGVPSLLLRPDDLDLSGVGSATDIGTIKRVIYESLLQAIAVQLGTLTSGLISRDAAKLRKMAIEKGTKSKDFVEKAVSALISLPIKIKGVDVMSLARKLAGGSGDTPTAKAIGDHLTKNHAIAFLLFDDTDQVASPSDSAHLNRLWGLLLALRKLSEQLENLSIIVTLRSEIWLRLQRDERGQRDQIDHFRPLIVDLAAGDELLSRILRRRFDLAVTDVRESPTGETPYKIFFSSPELTLPKSDERRPWATFILKSARDRPRDIIQLVSRLAMSAKKNRRDVIQSSDAEEAMHGYSEECLRDLAMEVGRDCPVFEEVVRTFADLPFDLPFDRLKKHIATIPSRFSVSVRGATLQPDSNSDLLRLLAVLWESGFINPRVIDERRAKSFRHILYRDDPNLVSPARWNELQTTTWEVHPAFRTWLLDVQADKTW